MSFQPVTMAKAAERGPLLLLGNLPEEIFAFEILVRLPPKALLRCHAVCRAWRRIASARDFLLAHHHRQPSLHLAYAYKHSPFCHEILTIDHQAAAAAKLQPVLQLSRDYVKASCDESDICLVASCDGLLVLCIGRMRFFLCNPATRQFVGLNLHGFAVRALYLHRPTGEYRLLLRSTPDDQTAIDRDLCYVLTLGCDQLPRCIGRPKDLASMWCTPVLVHGNLHWTLCYVAYDQHQSSNEMVITVFDTTPESFREMRAPMVANNAYLFEMDDMVGMYSCSDDMTVVNIWVMEDYEQHVWSLMRQVKLPVAEIRLLEGFESWDVMVMYEAGDVLVHLDCGRRVLHVDTEGKLLSSSNYDGHSLFTNLVKLKLSLVRHMFFSRLEGAVNAWPFI